MARYRLPLAGACQCGAVAYRLHGAPLTLYCCHCSECQHQSSSAFGMSSLVRHDDLEVDWSALQVWSRPATGGGRLDCHFCPGCGGRLFHVSAGEPQTVSIKVGSFDDRTWLQPIGHIWTASAQPWFTIPDGVLLDSGDPEELAPYMDRWREKTQGWFGA